MKRNLLALAVSGVIAVPAFVPIVAQADEDEPRVYGRLRLGFQIDDDQGANDNGNSGFRNNSSRFGIRGTEDLGNGLDVVYRYEFGVDATEADVQDNNRLSYVGLRGNFGEFTIGQQWANFYELIGSGYAYGEAYTGNYLIYDQGSFGSGRFNDSAKYRFTSGDLTLGADLVADPDNNRTDFADAFALTGKYTVGGADLSAGWLRSQNTVSAGEDAEGNALTADNEGDLFNAAIGYTISDALGGFFMFEHLDADSGDAQAYHAGLSGRSGNLGYHGTIDFIDHDNEASDGEIYTAGLKHFISKRTRVYGEVEINATGDDTAQRYIMGMRHDF